MKEGITIAIDGFSSCGKSTIAKQLASKLSYSYIDTGAMYRSITLYAVQNDFLCATKFDTQGLIDSLDKISIDYSYQAEKNQSLIRLNGKIVEDQIRGLNVSQYVSQVSALAPVRKKLVALQQQMGANGAVILDGRDIGTVVFPNAELKIFVTADPKVRAQRRMSELLSKGETVSYEQVFENLQHRDYLDQNRTESPLVRAFDARILDNTELNETEQLNLVLQWANEVI